MNKYVIVIYDENSNVIAKHKFLENKPPQIREGILYVDTENISYGYKDWAWYKNYGVEDND